MPRPITLPAPWASLAAKLGGVQAVADALHSSPRAVHQWAHGTRQPRGPALALIRALFQQHGLQPPV